VSLGTPATVLLAFVGLYPIVSAGFWIAGALVFRVFEEPVELRVPAAGWPGVTIVISAYNEEQVIAGCVEAALAVDYPELEVLLFDDGSKDRTADVARDAAGGDPRLRTLSDPVNRGKVARLNQGFEAARHELVVVTDADTHLHPQALKLLVARISRSALTAAVAGAPHVTNRRNLLCAMQVLEAASIIGLIRRTQAVAGRVGVVAGVLGIFRREAVLAVGGYQGQMATEDIDLTWRLLLAGWHTSYEPDALVGMEVPSTLSALWAQRRRWARGQGEVLHAHLPAIAHWRQRQLWPLALEGAASLLWVVTLAIAALLTTIVALGNDDIPAALLGLAWGIAVSVVATFQLAFALRIDFPYDRRAALAFLLGPVYPIAYWMISAAAALREEVPALLRGAPERQVSWDIPRDATSGRP
jgi:biofilm PGA synthesis N-glycosyltransferase PgaC